MAKSAPFDKKLPVKNFHGQAKEGAIAPWLPLKYATVWLQSVLKHPPQNSIW